jgi:hypothetical protein
LARSLPGMRKKSIGVLDTILGLLIVRASVLSR